MLKNWKTTTSKETATQEPKISSSAEGEKPSEEVLSVIATVVTANIGAKDENSKEVHEVCKYSVINIEHKDATHVIDKATETDTKLYNINSEDLQPICESRETVQNDSTTVEPTSVDRADSPSFAEPCSGSGNTVDEKSLTRQRQAIIAGIVGTALLVGSVAFYALKIDVTVAAVVGIVGLACIGLALYNIINPNTKLEKVEEQSITAHPPLKAI